MRVVTGSRSGRGRAAVRRMLLLVALLVAAGLYAPAGTATASPLGVPAYANPVTVGARAVVTNTDGDPIRVREGAGTRFARIAWAREGDVVAVLDGPVSGDGIEWFKVQATGARGWMMAQFLKGAAASSAPAADRVAARLSGTVRVANTDGDPLRVRTAPHVGGRVTGYLHPGTTAAVEEGPVTDSAGIVWYSVSSGGLRGWCMAVYLSPIESPGETAPAQSEPARSAPPQAEPASTTSASTRPTYEQLRVWIEEARTLHPYPDSTDKMWRVMMCESSGNPNAVGAGIYHGLFQYLPGTWAGGWNPYRNNSIWDARSQVFATARAWSLGMQRHWSCY